MQDKLRELERKHCIDWREYEIGELFTKRTMKGFPKKAENLEENNQGFHIFGQNIKYQYPQRVLIDEKYLHNVDENKPILAYTSSTGELGIITESFYRSGDNGAFQGLFFKYPDYNKNHILYLLGALSRIFNEFGYSTGMADILRVKVQLPTKNNEIAFNYIEEFIATLEAERLATLEAYLLATGLKGIELTKEEHEAINNLKKGSVIWSEFKIGNLFNISTGRDFIIGKTTNGNVPLVSHQHENNGITKYVKAVSNRRVFNHNTTISLADRGVFYATTQNVDFHIGTRVKALNFKDGPHDLTERLFVVSSINKLQILFTEYSANATDKLPDFSISLPIQGERKPDFKFMRTVIKAMQKVVIKGVVEYLDKRDVATAEIINL